MIDNSFKSQNLWSEEQFFFSLPSNHHTCHGKITTCVQKKSWKEIAIAFLYNVVVIFYFVLSFHEQFLFSPLKVAITFFFKKDTPSFLLRSRVQRVVVGRLLYTLQSWIVNVGRIQLDCNNVTIVILKRFKPWNFVDILPNKWGTGRVVVQQIPEKWTCFLNSFAFFSYNFTKFLL